MADEILEYDDNNYRVAGAVDDVGGEIRNIKSDSNGYIIAEITGIVNDYKVAVTTNDTTPDYLSSKIVDSATVTWTVNNPGANETYSAAVVPGAAAFYQRIQEDGVNLTQRGIFNFNTYFTVTDAASKTNITLDIAAIEPALDLANLSGFIDLSTQVTGLLSSTNIDITNLESTLDLGNISGSLDLTTQVTGVLPVPNGGTGASTLTGVLHGNGTSAVTGIPLTTDGAILIGDGSGAPTTLDAFSSATGTLKVDNGGTGRASHTAYAVICGGTTSTGAQQSVASVGTAGQALVSNGPGALPTFQNLTSLGVFQQTTQLGNLTILDSCSENDGSAIYVTALRLNGGTQRYVLKFTRDTNTGMYVLTSQTTTTPTFSLGDPSGMALLGNFVYIFYDTGGNVLCERITKSSIGTQTAMTVPVIAAPSSSNYCAWSDGTALYLVVNNGPTVYRFTVSGTTLTQTTTGTPAASLSNNAHYSSFFDGTDIYVTQEGQDVSKLSNALGTATVVTSYNLTPINVEGVFGSMSAYVDSSKMYIGAGGRFSDSGGNGTETLSLFPVTKP